MDSDEKLTALKRAYADVILNTSKEAAVRVLSSERRASRYEHELKVGREEGLRMLMRLKQMMGCKINQSKIASQNQQKKIEELEAQLHEAEYIVKDLREKLGEANDEIDRLKKDDSQHSNEPSYALKRETGNGIYSYNQSSKILHPDSEDFFPGASVPKPSQRNDCCMCNSEVACSCSSYSRCRDLPSIILRGKDGGLYRNGCTQRIRACERNLMDKALCLPGETERVNNQNNGREQIQREQEGGERDTSKARAFDSRTLTDLEKKLLPDRKFSNFTSFPQKGKRATRVRKLISPLNGKHEPILVKDCSHLRENLTETAHEGEAGSMKNFPSPNCNIEVEKVDSHLEQKCSGSVGERAIKYTFQRKRKREPFLSGSKPANAAAIETENETGLKQNGDEKEESSRDSRRLAQVARQLLSLSDKKWWN